MIRCDFCDRPRPNNAPTGDASQSNKPVKGWRRYYSLQFGTQWKCPECQTRDEWIWMCKKLLTVINCAGLSDTTEAQDARAAIAAYDVRETTTERST